VKKRDDEELCKSVFNTYLLTLFASEEIIWTPVKQKDEPPDFYLELAGENYAVEVTSLIEKMRMGGGIALPYFSTFFPLKQLVDEVSIRARKDDCLQGGYLVVFKEPFENFGNIKSRLEEGLLDYILKTKDEASAPESTIYKKFDRVCTITKVHNQTNEVNTFWNRDGINIDGMESGICHLAKKAIQEKEHLLRNISLPKIILLYDLYGFGEYNLSSHRIRKRCAEALADQFRAFKAIFVIRDDKKGFVFYPEKMEWKRTLFSKTPT
jgi:hypothetical protein